MRKGGKQRSRIRPGKAAAIRTATRMYHAMPIHFRDEKPIELYRYWRQCRWINGISHTGREKRHYRAYVTIPL